jgi:hypothetical protein
VSGQLHAPAALPSWYLLDRRPGGPQSLSERSGEEKNSQPLLGLEPPTIQPVAQHYTTELSGSWSKLLVFWIRNTCWNKFPYRTLKLSTGNPYHNERHYTHLFRIRSVLPLRNIHRARGKQVLCSPPPSSTKSNLRVTLCSIEHSHASNWGASTHALEVLG